MADWRTAKRLLTLLAEVNQLYPGRNKASDGTIGDAAHQKGKSEHNPDENGVVRALDITIPLLGTPGRVLADLIIANRDASLWYVIVDGQIWEDGKWSKYNGADQHYGHIHVSLYDKPELYDKTTPWLLKGGDLMVDDNFIRAFWEDLFRTQPSDDDKKKYIGTNWMVTYSALRNSDAHKKLVAYINQLEKDNAARADGLQKAQALISQLETNVDAEAQAKLSEIKQILEK